jgi:hypothetical protein
MILNDRVHGNWSIEEPVILELLQSPAMQRLAHVAQGGLISDWDPYPVYSRREHCIGAMLCVRRLGASLEEQVASLLHDVSHTAFSHVIDYVFGSQKDADYQDRTHEHYVRTRTDILDILYRHSLGEDCALRPHKFSLLEQPAPGLCADRVDYTLRGALNDGKIYTSQPFVEALRVRDGKMVFAAQDIAEAFWNIYVERQENNWAHPDHVAKANVLASAIRAGLDSRVIAESDLYRTDAELTARLRGSDNKDVRRKLQLLDKGFRIVPEQYFPDYVLSAKFRRIDPAFLKNGSVRRLSEVLPAYNDWFAMAREKYAQGIPVRIVPI